MNPTVRQFLLNPSSFDTLCTYAVELGPDDASTLLQLNTANRGLAKTRVEHYTRLMVQGDWTPGVADISFSTKGVLVNGQHTLSAIVASKATILVRLTFGLDPEASLNYDTGMARRATDALSMAFSDLPYRTYIASLHGLVKVWNAGGRDVVRSAGNHGRVGNSEITRWYADNADQIQFACKHGARIYNYFLETCGKGVITPAAAVMFTWALAEANGEVEVERFGDAIVSGVRTGHKDPLLAMQRKLQDRTQVGGPHVWSKVAALVLGYNRWVLDIEAGSFTTSTAQGSPMPTFQAIR